MMHGDKVDDFRRELGRAGQDHPFLHVRDHHQAGERRRQIPVQNLLQSLTEEDMLKLTTFLDDDKISEEVYLQKLDTVLSVVNDPVYESSDIGDEGLSVLKTWEQMDEGELEFDAGLKEATQREKPGGRREAKEEDLGEAEPA